MKYKILEWLFSWMNTPILHLSFMEICTALAELIIVGWIVSKIFKFIER